MASLLRSLRKSLSRTLFSIENPILVIDRKIGINPSGFSSGHAVLRRTYISEMRKAAFTETILRLLRNEVQYEIDRFPPQQPLTHFDSFKVDERPGEQWISMTRKISRNEEIKVEATLVDEVIPTQKPGVGDAKDDDALSHITMIVSISKANNDVLEVMCSAWPDSIEIKRLFIRRTKKMPAQAYLGPEFKELDDELQDSLYDFLESRGITDELAVFLHQYMKNKSLTEFIRWMDSVQSYIGSK